jgi:hypothetical protein
MAAMSCDHGQAYTQQRNTSRLHLQWHHGKWCFLLGLYLENDHTLKTTDPTSHQRGCPTSANPPLSKNNQREKGKNWSPVPDGCLTPRQTGRLTISHNITLTLTLTLS